VLLCASIASMMASLDGVVQWCFDEDRNMMGSQYKSTVED
jgi:hypothetical protein